MRILITGGAGFIGSHLADRLVDAGHHVTAVDNLSLGRIENIAGLMNRPEFAFRRLDLLDKQKLDEAFVAGAFDAVFHLAANSDIARSFENPDIDRDNTFQTTYSVLQAMRQHGVRQLVFASTSAIYGETTAPLEETYGPLFPVSHYGAGKLASEAFISSFSTNYGIQAWIVRFPNVVGERATHGVIHDFIGKLRRNPQELEVLGNGEQNKPYLYVKDLVSAIVHIWTKTSDRLNFFNVGVETRTKVRRIAELVVQEMETGASIRFTGGDRGWVGDVPQFNYCLDKIHALGWRAECSSDEAVRKAICSILEKAA